MSIKRSSVLLIVSVNGANPNGDPDSNLPRTLDDDRGFITSVALKAHIRNMMEDHDNHVFQAVQSVFELDPERFHILESFFRGCQEARDANDAVMAKDRLFEMIKNDKTGATLLNKFVDPRWFGTTCLEEKEKKEEEDGVEDVAKPKSKTKTKAAKPKSEGNNNFKRTGPITVSNGVSVAPVTLVEATLGKKAPFQDGHLKALQGTLAPYAMKFVAHGLYVFRIAICPQMAKYTLTTQQDIDVFKFLLPRLFVNTPSCSRPIGTMEVVSCLWADHDSPIGSFNEFDFFETLTPKANVAEPKSKNDYTYPNKYKDVKIVDLAKTMYDRPAS